MLPVLPRSAHVVLSLAALAVLAACNRGNPGAHGGGFPPPEVATMDVAQADVPVTFEYVGQTSGSREVEIRARVTGIVDKRLYQEGARVKAGQPLFKLDAAGFTAQAATAEANVATAEARVRQAEREYNRLKALLEAKATSQKEYDDASSNLDLARAGLKAAQAQWNASKVDLAYTEIHAPISGVVGRALKVEGALVNAQGDNLLATLAQTDPMHVNFGVPEADALRLKQEIATGALKLPTGGYVVRVKTSDGKELGKQGKLDFSDYKADTNTGSYLNRAVLPNSDDALAPGQFVRVELTGAIRPKAITVPQRAVLNGPMGKFVYVLGKGKEGEPVAEARPVVPGDWVALNGPVKNAWVIREGLRAGDKVIIDGMARIFMPGSPVKPGGAAPAGGAEAAKPAEAPAKPAATPADAKPAADQPAAKS